jgi:hypothetical protein
MSLTHFVVGFNLISAFGVLILTAKIKADAKKQTTRA